MSFLCTRSKSPDIEDWKALKRILCFIMQTEDDKWIIRADNLNEMQTFIDSVHVVHKDMKRHIRRVTKFGICIIIAKSSKQEMKSRSSNESEVIRNSEYLPCVIWYEYFMEADGYLITSNIM